MYVSIFKLAWSARHNHTRWCIIICVVYRAKPSSSVSLGHTTYISHSIALCTYNVVVPLTVNSDCPQGFKQRHYVPSRLSRLPSLSFSPSLSPSLPLSQHSHICAEQQYQILPHPRHTLFTPTHLPLKRASFAPPFQLHHTEFFHLFGTFSE